MSAFVRRALGAVVFVSLASTALAADFGRTLGTLGVSQSGAADYSIPIWAPPGPNGIQPSISLNYNSQAGKGVGGVGWNFSGLGAISRCGRTWHQDGGPQQVMLSSNDRLCINGNRMRLVSGTYLSANSVYQTEFADYSRITAYTSASGGIYFLVEAKSGLKYEYGNSTSSKTPVAWMVNKVFDRNGNNYVVAYTNTGGIAVPATISWTPTSLGSSTYRYQMSFTYTTGLDADSIFVQVYGISIVTRERIESISVSSGGVVRRKYRFNYEISQSTSRSRLTSAKECADDLETNCLLPINFTYQNGQAGLTVGAASPPAGSSNGIFARRYDFNGDGKDDIAYKVGTAWYVALGTNSGFSTPYNTGLVSTSVTIDKFLPTGRAAFVGVVSNVLWVYRWDDATSAFVSYNTGIASTTSGSAVDFNGDGLEDLVWMETNKRYLQVRTNSSTGSGNPSFGALTNTAGLPTNWKYIGFAGTPSKGLRHLDINGDGREDINVGIIWIGGDPPPPEGEVNSMVALGSNLGFTVPSSSSWVYESGFDWPSVNFNGDTCTDRVHGSVVQISACNGSFTYSVNLPGTPLQLLDWDGDGKTDFLMDSGGTFGVYKSNGNNYAPLIPTSISSAGTFFAADLDGDGLDDLVKVNGTSAISYWTHTLGGTVPAYATNVPDLLVTASDGYGVATTFNYVSTSWGNYDKGATTSYPLQEAGPRIVVAKAARSDGIGGAFDTNYFYVGARVHAARAQGVGVQRFDQTDSRNGLISRTYFEQSFPLSGEVSQREVMQPGGVTAISRAVYTNAFTTLDSTANNQRYFSYPQGSTATRYEVGGGWNGNLLSTVATANLFDSTSGTLYDRTVTTTEPASGANGAAPGGSWVEHTVMPTASLLNDIPYWCLGRPGKILQTNSHNLAYGTLLTRTTDISWNAASCRPTQTVAELGSSTLQVTTALGYDSFGNLNSSTVTGIGMTARTTTSVYSNGSFTTGQFPLSVTNALNQTSTTAWNYDLGVPIGATDPNGISISWEYDSFGRRNRENRPDGTYTTWGLFDVCPSCSAQVRSYVETNVRDAGGTSIDRSLQYLDIFDRPTYTYLRNFDGTYSVSTPVYDALGRTWKEYFPVPSAGDWVGFKEFAYDIANRPTTISSPISDASSTRQTTTIYYEGLTTRIWDAQSKYTYKIMNAAGQLARSQDHDGYYQNFDYDSFGNPMRVQDASGVLQSSTFNIRGVLTQRTDMDMGTWNFTPNALGEVVSQTDAKSQVTTFTFDFLGRLTTRGELEGTSTWTWGTSSASKNIGQLSSVSGPGYSESYAYDSIGRPQSTTISADTNYQIDFSYNSSGALDTLTYPQSTASYRLKTQYEYQNGQLRSIKDYNAPTTVFWTANTLNVRNQITQEILGNGLVTNRSYDKVTGLLKSIQTGVGGGTGVQNLAYEWDLVGNLKKRKDVIQSNLTEEFFYDNVYRLDYSNLNGSSTPNLDMAYDLLGNITSKSDVGSYSYHATKRHQVTSAGSWSFGYDNNGNMTSGRGRSISWTSYNYPLCITSGTTCTGTTSDYSQFSYTPDREYWKQVSNFTSGGTATTIYVRGLLEKVSTSTGDDYRHYIRAGGSTIIVSRRSSGTNPNNTFYVTSDHLGSDSVISDGSGSPLVNESFDAFGRRRGSNWSGGPSSGDWAAIASTTRLGYTEHSMLDNLELIHMNGRQYDPLLGRFTSADPYITAPGNTQNYNRYSYVYNNPLSALDPSGFNEVHMCEGGVVCPPPTLSETDDPRQSSCNNGFGGILTSGACSYVTSQIGLGDAIANAEAARHQHVIPQDLYSDSFNTQKVEALVPRSEGLLTGPLGRFILLVSGKTGYQINPLTGKEETPRAINDSIGEVLAMGVPLARLESAIATRVGLAEARLARDALARELAPLGRRAPATITGGYNRVTRQVAARACGGGKCAEDHVVEALGGNRAHIDFTEAMRPRTGEEIPICYVCEGNYGRKAFPADALFKSDE